MSRRSRHKVGKIVGKDYVGTIRRPRVHGNSRTNPTNSPSYISNNATPKTRFLGFIFLSSRLVYLTYYADLLSPEQCASCSTINPSRAPYTLYIHYYIRFGGGRVVREIIVDPLGKQRAAGTRKPNSRHDNIIITIVGSPPRIIWYYVPRYMARLSGS